MVARRRSKHTLQTPERQTPRTPTFPFGPRPILKGENSEAYDALYTRISMDVKPTDFIEKIWIWDVAYLTWEILRYRRIKENWLAALKSDALENELEDVLDRKGVIGWNQLSESEQADLVREERENPSKSLPEERELVKKWASGDPAAMKRIDKLLAWDNETLDTVEARAFVDQLDKIEALQRLIATLEGRRNAILREIDRHRAVFAQLLRAKLQDVEIEGEFESVETRAIART
jgi:hypothetical protein